MAKFASLFSSPADADRAIRALKASFSGENVTTQVVDSDAWKANWDLDDTQLEPHGRHSSGPDLLDLWLDRRTADSFTEGLKKGGAVLVIDVPDEYARQAQKIVKDKNGKLE